MSEPKSGLSRRTVLKGAAWSVPVVAVATAVPAYAASGDVSELDFYLTAGQMIGQGATGAGASGQFRSNGIRLTSPDGKTIPAGVTVVFTLTYNPGSEPVDFTDPQFGFDYNIGLNQGWVVDPVEPHRVVFTATSTVAASEITFQAAQWWVNQGVRPEDDSVTFTGIATVPAGGDYPQGGTLTSLVVDPNQGTGSLSGPGDHGAGGASTWPVV
jgi:hypothetical protein